MIVGLPREACRLRPGSLKTNFHEPIRPRHRRDEEGHRIGQEPDVPDEDDQQRPVHRHRPDPQRQVGRVDQPRPIKQLGLRVSQERTEEQHFQRHSSEYGKFVVWIRQRLLLDPGK